MTPQVDSIGRTMTVRPGEEAWEVYDSPILLLPLVQYDYRHTDGTPFSCVARTVGKCREKRDHWLAMRPKPLAA